MPCWEWVHEKESSILFKISYSFRLIIYRLFKKCWIVRFGIITGLTHWVTRLTEWSDLSTEWSIQWSGLIRWSGPFRWKNWFSFKKKRKRTMVKWVELSVLAIIIANRNGIQFHTIRIQKGLHHEDGKFGKLPAWPYVGDHIKQTHINDQNLPFSFLQKPGFFFDGLFTIITGWVVSSKCFCRSYFAVVVVVIGADP